MAAGERRVHRKGTEKKRFRHRTSMLMISFVIVLLAVFLVAGSMSLRKKDKAYAAKEAELKERLGEEKNRSDELDDLEEYVGTDEYIEDIARDKLGLLDPNEILFKADP